MSTGENQKAYVGPSPFLQSATSQIAISAAGDFCELSQAVSLLQPKESELAESFSTVVPGWKASQLPACAVT